MMKHGFAVVDIDNLDCFAFCDRCSMLWNHSNLRWQYEWAGTRLTNLRLLVCPNCLDKPDWQKRTIRLPPDPVPIKDPRPGTPIQDISPARAISQGPQDIDPMTGMPNNPPPILRWTQMRNTRAVQQTGDPLLVNNIPGQDMVAPGSIPLSLPPLNSQIPNTGTPPNSGGSDS
jgi:hypothetical protein